MLQGLEGAVLELLLAEALEELMEMMEEILQEPEYQIFQLLVGEAVVLVLMAVPGLQVALVEQVEQEKILLIPGLLLQAQEKM
tara:strand:+ start:593 stop:841 length:249 start_codon:yes stop_codon:yes gene_type:complete